MYKRIAQFYGLLALLLVLLIPAGPASAKTTLTMAAIGKTSDTYMVAVGWSTVLSKIKADAAITPLEGGGTVKLLRGVAAGKWDIGFIGSPHYVNALEGTLKFEKDPPELREKYKNIRALFGVTSGMGQYVVRADSDVRKITDLKGKKVGIGRPGGMGGTVTQAIYKANGLEAKKDYQPQYLKYGPALDEMRNNRLEATLLWGGIPQAAAYNFSRQIPVRFLPIDPAAFAEFKKEMPQGEWYVLRTFTPDDLEKGYGEGVKQDGANADFWTFQMQVVCRGDMPEETAYEIVKAFWENVEEVKATGAALSKLNHTDGLEALSAELHPGAAKYYKEKGWIK